MRISFECSEEWPSDGIKWNLIFWWQGHTTIASTIRYGVHSRNTITCDKDDSDREENCCAKNQSSDIVLVTIHSTGNLIITRGGCGGTAVITILDGE